MIFPLVFNKMSFPCSSNHINLSNLPVFLCQANNFTDLWQAKLMFSLFARRPPELQNLLARSLFVPCSLSRRHAHVQPDNPRRDGRQQQIRFGNVMTTATMITIKNPFSLPPSLYFYPSMFLPGYNSYVL